MEPVRVHDDLVLLFKPANACHLGDTRHALDRVFESPVLERAQIGQVVRPGLIDQDILEHPPHTGRVRTYLGFHAGREASLYLGQVFEDAAPGPVDIGAVREDDIYVGKSEIAVSADRLYPGSP